MANIYRNGNGAEIHSSLETRAAQGVLKKCGSKSPFLKSMADCRFPTESQLYYIHKLAMENMAKVESISEN